MLLYGQSRDFVIAQQATIAEYVTRARITSLLRSVP
jgi:hypothetical protein